MARWSKDKIKEMVKADYTMLYRPMPAEIKAVYPLLSMNTSNDVGGLHIATKHEGKMDGMSSISTSCKCNGVCPPRIEAALKGYGSKGELSKAIKADPLSTDFSICGFCFADALQNFKTSIAKCGERNFQILNNGIIHPDWLPILNTVYFRGESFGDFASKNAVVNFCNLCKKNPHTTIAVWTKNPGFFYMAFKEVPKPDNMIVVLSSQYINKKTEIPARFRWFVDKVFTVYTKQFSKKYDVNINCGSRSCLGCLNCYRKDGTDEISELLK